jgi:hypothetical protein
MTIRNLLQKTLFNFPIVAGQSHSYFKLICEHDAFFSKTFVLRNGQPVCGQAAIVSLGLFFV